MDKDLGHDREVQLASAKYLARIEKWYGYIKPLTFTPS